MQNVRFLHASRTYLAAFWRENRKFLLILASILCFKSAVADLNSISGRSMQPTLLDGDKVWVNKLAYDIKLPFTGISVLELAEPTRGDIVIIDSEVAGKRLVKRIIGEPGDTVYMRNNLLVVNDEVVDFEILSESHEGITIVEHLFDETHQALLSSQRGSRSTRSYGPAQVPENHFFVLGDNRDNSADSRLYSFIPRAQIVGRSSSVVFSMDSDHAFRPRSGRFMATLD
ncbi:MAG: signal peptidase I [Gammaproteobacteria bacterium]|nr:signal peptidase I [Gammaproteobacteria bacterium]